MTSIIVRRITCPPVRVVRAVLHFKVFRVPTSVGFFLAQGAYSEHRYSNRKLHPNGNLGRRLGWPEQLRGCRLPLENHCVCHLFALMPFWQQSLPSTKPYRTESGSDRILPVNRLLPSRSPELQIAGR